MNAFFMAPLNKARGLARSYCTHAHAERVFRNEISTNLLHSRGFHSHLRRHLSSTLVCVPWLLSRGALLDFLGDWLPAYLRSLGKRKRYIQLVDFTISLFSASNWIAHIVDVKKLGVIFWPKSVWKGVPNNNVV